MPWDKRKTDDGKWHVINSETGAVKGTHDTEQDANDQLAALYANADPEKEKVEKMQNLFIPIQKVDEARHEVWGVAAVEEPDNSDEIFDYQTSKPYFLDWSKRAQKRSGGKSLGNVRSMHQNIAAGKLISLQADDATKSISVGAKIIDENEWKKVETGVYTGFSIGGGYVKRWTDYTNPRLVRYTGKPTELSLVDSPCISSATFEVLKADGQTLLQKFAQSEGDSETLVILDDLEKYDPDEARDESGRWSGGGGVGGEKDGEAEKPKQNRLEDKTDPEYEPQNERLANLGREIKKPPEEQSPRTRATLAALQVQEERQHAPAEPPFTDEEIEDHLRRKADFDQRMKDTPPRNGEPMGEWSERSGFKWPTHTNRFIPKKVLAEYMTRKKASQSEKAVQSIMQKMEEFYEILDGIAGELQKISAPEAPEPIADMPLKSEVGPDYNVEQMPPPNVLLELKPNETPDQDVLAQHAVASRKLDALVDSWMPKIGEFLKSAVREAYAESADGLSKAADSAPALTIAVKRGKRIQVVRKGETHG